MTLTAKEATLVKTLLPLALDASKASAALQEWRQDAGAKSTWSNHNKLTEAALFSRVDKAFSALGAVIVGAIPAQWEMSDWGFAPSRMGGTARWASKAGRGRDGIVYNTASLLCFIMDIGTMIGVIVASQRGDREDLARMKSLDLSNKGISTFSFSTYRCFLQAKGYHPRDAFGALILKGQMDKPVPPGRSINTPELALQAGLSWARKTLTRGRNWSAAPTLWAQLRKDARVRKLAGPAPKVNTFSPPWKEHGLERYDRVLAAALSLLRSLPAKPGALGTYLVNRGSSWGEGAQGWCGTSAILGCVIRDLDDGKLPADIDKWRAFSLADECGGPARMIAEAYLPPTNPDTARR